MVIESGRDAEGSEGAGEGEEVVGVAAKTPFVSSDDIGVSNEVAGIGDVGGVGGTDGTGDVGTIGTVDGTGVAMRGRRGTFVDVGVCACDEF